MSLYGPLRGAPGLSELISTLLDAEVNQDRLEQLARLTAERHWKNPDSGGWSHRATFLFRAGGRHMYATFPIWRDRYYAVVRIDREDIPNGIGKIQQADVQVRAISVLESEALKLMCQDAAEEA